MKKEYTKAELVEAIAKLDKEHRAFLSAMRALCIVEYSSESDSSILGYLLALHTMKFINDRELHMLHQYYNASLDLDD